MRVIGGAFRGRRLKVAEVPGLRPTIDRVREAIFNILAARIDFEGMRVLDLFAGSGALGIEALSRGADRALFIEDNRRAVAVIKENLELLGVSSQGRVILRDAMQYLRSSGGNEKFDVIFADPPYRAPFLNELLQVTHTFLSDSGMLVLERSAEICIVEPEVLTTVLARRIGGTTVGLYQV
ncbi:MAG: 16S rRNA (guanine(966)-N(2))-methyltransferase RsmD [Chlorobi bacterium]|nr:16S rRNA (guanine(966)-N(2))-methyltransferase RsmD [Chlorobiota bacterium]